MNTVAGLFSSLPMSTELLILLSLVLIFHVVRFIRRHSPASVYTKAELESFSEAAEKAFGESDSVFHEPFSPDLHIDILRIPPQENCPFITLCTMGVGAHRMTVPEEELQEAAEKDEKLRSFLFPGHDRVELLMYLPADRDPRNRQEGLNREELERLFAPIGILKNTACAMVAMDTWYAFSHTVSTGESLRPGSPYTAVAFASPLPDCAVPGFTLKAGEKDVSVLMLLPLTQEEYDTVKEKSPEDSMAWLQSLLPAEPDSLHTFIDERMKKL